MRSARYLVLLIFGDYVCIRHALQLEITFNILEHSYFIFRIRTHFSFLIQIYFPFQDSSEDGKKEKVKRKLISWPQGVCMNTVNKNTQEFYLISNVICRDSLKIMTVFAY